VVSDSLDDFLACGALRFSLDSPGELDAAVDRVIF
jgi:hypothetical protein